MQITSHRYRLQKPFYSKFINGKTIITLYKFLKYHKLELIFWKVLHEPFDLLSVIASLKDGPSCKSQGILEVIDGTPTVDQMPIMRICPGDWIS